MIIFLLFVIALLLLLIYRHLTKDEREKARLEKFLIKQEQDYRRIKAMQERENVVDEEPMPKENLSDQINKYHKVHKTWNWRK